MTETTKKALARLDNIHKFNLDVYVYSRQEKLKDNNNKNKAATKNYYNGLITGYLKALNTVNIISMLELVNLKYYYENEHIGEGA